MFLRPFNCKNGQIARKRFKNGVYMQKISFFSMAFAALLVSNAIAFDPAGNSNPQVAKDPDQAERMQQMSEIWNSMTPEEKAASNAEKARAEYQATTIRNANANKSKEARLKQVEQNRASSRQYGSEAAY